MGSSESIHNDTNQGVEVAWAPVMNFGGKTPLGPTLDGKKVEPNEEGDHAKWLIGYQHGVCIRYDKKKSEKSKKIEKVQVCKTLISPDGPGEHVIHTVSSIIGNNTLPPYGYVPPVEEPAPTDPPSKRKGGRGGKGKLAVLESHVSNFEYSDFSLIAVIVFTLALIGLKKFRIFRQHVSGSQEPLIHA